MLPEVTPPREAQWSRSRSRPDRWRARAVPAPNESRRQELLLQSRVLQRRVLLSMILLSQ